MIEHENNKSRQRFELYSSFGNELHARALLKEIHGVRVVPPSKKEAIIVSHGNDEGFQTRKNVVAIRGVAINHGALRRTGYSLSRAGILEGPIFLCPQRKSREEQEKEESETLVVFENGYLSIFHGWGRKIGEGENTSWESNFGFISTFNSHVTDQFAERLRRLYKRNKIQYNRIVDELKNKRESVSDFDYLITLEWAIAEFDEITQKPKE